MNALALLQVPWRSAHRSMRWLSLVVLVLCGGGAILLAALTGGPDRWTGTMAVYGFGLFYLWAFSLSTCLLLAIDTRQLRVPGAQRQIVFGLIFYGVLLVALPAGLMAAFGAPFLSAAIMLALIGVCGLMFSLLPRFVIVFFGVMPSLLKAIWHRFDLPGLGDPSFVQWGAVMTLVLLVVVVLRWRQLLIAGPNLSMGWSSPMVIQFRNGNWGQWNNIGDNRMLRQRPDWLRPVIDLHNAGPGNPNKALRVALGGWYLPQTLRSYVKQLALLLCIVLVPTVASILLTRSNQAGPHVEEVMRGTILGAFGSLSVIAGPMICLLTMVWISKRWQRTNAELPLLALMPGLGGPAHSKRSLLRVGLGLPLLMHALLILLAVAAMLFWQGHLQLLSFMLLAQVGAAAMTAAIVLNLFSGHAITTLSICLMLVAAFVLTMLSLLLPAVGIGRHPLTWAASLLSALALAWLLLIAAMVWFGRRGWRDLMRQPHPFLVN